MSLFDLALVELLKHEGGFVNHPRDPGGITNLGVTKRVYERWKGRPVGEREMRELTPDKVAPLYYKKYWLPVKAENLPAGVALHVFDFGVNAGPRRAIRYLQKAVGAPADGLYGPLTKIAVNNYLAKHGEIKLIERYAALRMRYYKGLPIFRYFGRGWTRRVNEVTETALKWAR
jgi:lysozyme family protein